MPYDLPLVALDQKGQSDLSAQTHALSSYRANTHDFPQKVNKYTALAKKKWIAVAPEFPATPRSHPTIYMIKAQPFGGNGFLILSTSLSIV